MSRSCVAHGSVFQESRPDLPDSKWPVLPVEEARAVSDEEVARQRAEPWQPPWWLLVFAPFCWLLTGGLVLSQRGLVVALVALSLLAPLGMPIPFILRWVRRHHRLRGGYLGPVTFALVSSLTSLPLWLCTAATIGATLLGLVVTTTRDFAQG
jgi:hypothetical protein